MGSLRLGKLLHSLGVENFSLPQTLSETSAHHNVAFVRFDMTSVYTFESLPEQVPENVTVDEGETLQAERIEMDPLFI